MTCSFYFSDPPSSFSAQSFAPRWKGSTLVWPSGRWPRSSASCGTTPIQRISSHTRKRPANWRRSTRRWGADPLSFECRGLPLWSGHRVITGRRCVSPKDQGGLGVGGKSPSQGGKESWWWRRRGRWRRGGRRGWRWRRWWIDGEWYSGHFLVYKAFNPLYTLHLLKGNTLVSKGSKQKRLCISVVFMLYSFCSLFFLYR